jgi:hypothetical protein
MYFILTVISANDFPISAVLIAPAKIDHHLPFSRDVVHILLLHLLKLRVK